MVVNVLQAIYFAHAGLWAQFGLQFVLFAMSAHGWRGWRRAAPRSPTRRPVDAVEERSPMPAFEHALVVGKFAPLHRGHQALLDHAAAIARRLTVIVWSNPDFPRCRTTVRAGWVRELYPAATVLVGDDGPANTAPDAEQHDYVRRLLRRHGLTPDVVCTNEDYGPAFAASLGVAARAVRQAGERRSASVAPRSAPTCIAIAVPSTHACTGTSSNGSCSSVPSRPASRRSPRGWPTSWARSPSPSTGASTTNVAAGG